jgi:hypothetical protein
MRALLRCIVVAVFVACSSEPAATNNLPTQLPSMPPVPTNKNPTIEPTTKVVASQSTSTPAPVTGEVVLSDVMLRVRENGAPLLLGGEEGKAAEAKMEKLFLKIRAAAPNTAPDDWKDAWFAITESAIAGKPDPLGRRPWSSACKKCHDTYRDNYKQKYHTRTIPVTLDDVQ